MSIIFSPLFPGSGTVTPNPEPTPLLPISPLEIEAPSRVWLKWAIIAVIPLTALATFAAATVRISLLEVNLFIGITTISKIILWFLTGHGQPRRATGFKVGIFADIILLSLFLCLFGGPTNPFSILFLVHIAVAAMVFSPAWLWFVTILCWLGFAISFFIHRPLPLMGHHHHGDSFSLHLSGMWFAFVVASSLLAFLISKLSATIARKHEQIVSLTIGNAHQHRLAALTTLAAGAAHELSTPLGTILIAAEELLGQVDALEQTISEPQTQLDRIRDDSVLIRKEVQRCAEILQHMAAPVRRENASVNESCTWASIKQAIIERFGKEHLLFDAFPPDETVLRCSKEDLATSLNSIVKNALESQNDTLQSIDRKDHSETPIAITAMICKREGFITIEVKDHGVGISSDHLPHIGEPFFTTKEVGRGLGLGLFLVRLFAARVGGSCAIRSTIGEGSAVSLRLPLLT